MESKVKTATVKGVRKTGVDLESLGFTSLLAVSSYAALTRTLHFSESHFPHKSMVLSERQRRTLLMMPWVMTLDGGADRRGANPPWALDP